VPQDPYAPPVEEPSEMEDDMLSSAIMRKDSSRLGCQIKVSPQSLSKMTTFPSFVSTSCLLYRQLIDPPASLDLSALPSSLQINEDLAKWCAAGGKIGLPRY
jgi:hypothetical protein